MWVLDTGQQSSLPEPLRPGLQLGVLPPCTAARGHRPLCKPQSTVMKTATTAQAPSEGSTGHHTSHRAGTSTGVVPKV